MPSGGPLLGRADTRTSEQAEHEKSPPRIRPKRTIRPQNSYAREQEERRGKATRQQDEKQQPPEDTPTDNNDLKPVKLLAEHIRLREEIKKRDEAHEKELQNQGRIRNRISKTSKILQPHRRRGLRTLLTNQPRRHPAGAPVPTLHNHQTNYNKRQSIVSPGCGRRKQDTACPTFPLAQEQEQAKEVNCIRINTKPNDTDGEDENARRYLSPGSAVAHIQNALAAIHVTKGVQVLRVGTARTDM
jgi:hypothetical protein